MGVTEVCSYFMRITGHNSTILYQIPTKLGTEIHFNEPFKCAKFQLDQSTHLYFMANFAKCATVCLDVVSITV